MKGDFTRWTFRPEMHYHGVLKQQGRVDLDADWNEQNAITAHRVEVETRDVLGPSAAPAGNAGFLLTPAKNGATLTIAKGRAYIDGILIENEAELPIDAQPDLPGVGLPKAPGLYLAYLEVFERHVTMLDDPEIREVALGGPDTCTRARTVWQVKLMPSSSLGVVDCASPIPAWDALTVASGGMLAARAEPDPTAADPCTIPVKAGYRRLENQLYRVEIHAGSTPGPATFKWSRENGSIVASVLSMSQNGDAFTVNSVGPDGVLGFAAGEWIELIDDTHELLFTPGTLVRIQKVDGNTITVDKTTATGSLDHKDFPQNPKVRRWDAVGNSPALAKATHGSWLNLESGVQVEFSGANHSTGDYWMIPARTLTGDVDWPVKTGNPVALLPKGVHKHYARLAVLQLQGPTWSVVTTCLPIFNPIGTASPSKGFHVTAVNLVSGKEAVTPLDNDDVVPITQMRDAAVEVVFDQAVNPVCAKLPACFMTVDIPFTGGALTGGQTFPGFQPIILNDTVSVRPGGNGIRLAMGVSTLIYLETVLKASGARVLAHVTLKGAKLWSEKDPSRYLDGEAYGKGRGDKISLRLPSGGCCPGSDFEMWFWLTQQATGGVEGTGTVAVTNLAPPKRA
jgi:hypothetical protein